MVDVQPDGIVRLQVERKGLAGRSEQLAVPLCRYVVSPVRGDGARSPVELHLGHRLSIIAYVTICSWWQLNLAIAGACLPKFIFRHMFSPDKELGNIAEKDQEVDH